MSSGKDFTTAYVALGGNLGDRRRSLAAAADALAASPGIADVARSRLYETVAVSREPQPDYLNAVLRVNTTVVPVALLALCLDIEARLGRRRPSGSDKAPRLIDLDLLLWGASVVDQPGLRLPHPALLDRPFVRIPLADVALPGLQHPLTGTPLDQASPDPAVRLFAPGWP